METPIVRVLITRETPHTPHCSACGHATDTSFAVHISEPREGAPYRDDLASYDNMAGRCIACAYSDLAARLTETAAAYPMP